MDWKALMGEVALGEEGGEDKPRVQPCWWLAVLLGRPGSWCTAGLSWGSAQGPWHCWGQGETPFNQRLNARFLLEPGMCLQTSSCIARDAFQTIDVVAQESEALLCLAGLSLCSR